ncbi:MAG: HlyC/CorC family transporter [Blastocatellia bacterium]|nr:HlyC/CorC family transporter [Blastocatellia bacterium]
MEYEIPLTGIAIVVLVIVATAKSALDELSDVSLRLIASEYANTSRAEFIRSIVEHYHSFSFTLTFGIHLSIATIAILITSVAFKIHNVRFLLIAFAAVVATLIVFRLVVPLLLTQNDPARMLLWLRVPLKIIYPALAVISLPIYRMLRGLQREEVPLSQTEEEEETTESELQALIDVGEEEGIIEENEGEMIQSIIRFSDRTVGEVMTPRTKVFAVEANASIEIVRDVMIESKYSRLPVYRDQIDHIEGVIYVRDLLTHWASGETDKTALQLARPTYFVPESKPTDELLREMQKAKVQMAMVIDEYGGIAGLITLEDLVEEIVGEIEDEDEPEPHATEAEVVLEADGNYSVLGAVEVGKVERLFETELATDDFTTVAGLVINQLGHLPSVGEIVDFHGLHFEVTEADERRVSRVKIVKIAEQPIVAEAIVNAATAPKEEIK